QQEEFTRQQHLVAGTAYLADLSRRELVIREHPTQREIKRIPLGGNQRFDVNDWERWGNNLLVVQPEDGTRLGELDWQTASLYGLVAAEGKTYLYNEGRLNTDYLPLARQAIFGGVFKGKPQSTPYDLYLSRGGKWLCISDRGAGTIQVLDTASLEIKGTVSLREAGRPQGLNLAIDEAQDQVYITDNQTASLQVLDLKSMELRRERVGQGILGNLVLTADGQHLYIITIKPNEGLIYLKTGSWETEKSIKLKGQLFFPDSSDPCDLLSLSPDDKSLLIVTYLNDPNPFTPVVSVIDAHQGKTLKRYSLKDGVKPFGLAYGSTNPVRPYTKPLEELILAAGLIEPRVLWAAKRELQLQLGEDIEEEGTPKPKKEKEEEAEEEAAEETVEEVVEEVAEPEEEKKPDEPEYLEVNQIHIAVPVREDPDKSLNVQPKKAEKINLPAAAVEEILEILINTFQKQIDEDISGYDDVMARLRGEAEKARKDLEEYDSTIIQIDSLFEGKHLQTAVLREAILMMLELKETVKTTVVRTVPSNCPNCKQALLGSWDCDACGFELESPDRAFKRRIASADAIANLPMGHMVIPDPQGLRLLQLNPYKYVVWNLDPDQLSGDYPVDALWLPNNNVLTVDKDGNKVMEVGSRGKVFWSFDTATSAQHVLKEPAKVTYYVPIEESLSAMRLLIVDQGHHRVIEVNRKHEILMEFGILGEPGSEDGKLCSPSDVQYTHDETYLVTDTGNNRIIEYKKTGGVKEIFGPGLGLNKPTHAQRLFNERTLIVDSGNYRLIEIDGAGQIVHESLYYTPAVDEKFRVVSPLKMVRLINKEIVLLDEDKLIQIRLKDNKLVWHTMIEDLAFQPKVAEATIVIDENGVEQRVYNLVDHGHIRPMRLSQKINFKRMQKLIEARMRNEVLPGEGDDDDKSASAADRLRALIEDRKIEQKRSLQHELSLDTFQPSEIFQKDEADVRNLRLYCLDRNHNAVIRINRKGEVKWHYGFEMGQTLNRPHFISETKRTLLVADTMHNRVLELSKADKEVVMDFKGPASSPLSGPRSALRLSMGRTLIADQRKKRLVELNSRGDISWEFDKAGQISSPQYAEELESGNILFADTMLNSLREVDRNGNLRWSFGSRIKGNGPGQLFAPEFGTRLVNGNTLIADTRNNRVIEVSYEGREVWIFTGDPRNPRRRLLNPVRCERLENGNTLVIYNNHREVIEVTPAFETVWYFKMGNDVFLPPVHGDTRGLKQLVEKLIPYYNPIEKRLIRSAEDNAMWGMEAHITLMDNVQMKSVRASLILMELEKAGTVVKTFPSPEELLADKFGKHLIVALILDPGSNPDAIAENIRYLAEVDDARLERIGIEEAEQAVASGSI
ncbi:MAG: hypothetical protein CVV27_10905, partial [Candidatus Melainabacteria bacterium HGW-Melainabacteria-1]